MNAVILIADDNDDDVLLLQRALQFGKIRNETREVSNGEEAICYLSGVGKYEDRTKYPFPLLLFLNLQMPRKNGVEVLAWLSTRRNLPKVKLIVLTGTLDPRQTRQAVHLGADKFLSKPPETEWLVQTLKEMTDLSWKTEGDGFLLEWATP